MHFSEGCNLASDYTIVGMQMCGMLYILLLLCFFFSLRVSILHHFLVVKCSCILASSQQSSLYWDSAGDDEWLKTASEQAKETPPFPLYGFSTYAKEDEVLAVYMLPGCKWVNEGLVLQFSCPCANYTDSLAAGLAQVSSWRNLLKWGQDINKASP